MNKIVWQSKSKPKNKMRRTRSDHLNAGEDGEWMQLLLSRPVKRIEETCNG
jgi:hypothetical protein